MADYIYLTAQGVIVPDTQALLQTVTDEFRVAFGSTLIISLNSPQGLLIAAEVLARAVVVANNAQLANQINPNIAGGVYLDALLQLLDAKRVAATSTAVNANLTGIAGTIVPINSIAQNSVNGAQFQSLAQVTLSGAGTATVAFQAILTGPITCDPNTLTKVISNVPGWETVTNPSGPTVLGQETATDVQARNQRTYTLATNSNGLAESVITRISVLPGVLGKPTFLQNKSSATVIIDGVTMVPHSMYLNVDGGDDNAIANTLQQTKGGGCDYNGNVSVPIVEPFSNQLIIVKFSRPDPIRILVNVTIKANTSIQDPVTIVRNAITDYASGMIPGELGLVIGADVSPFELSGAINKASPSLFVSDVEISVSSPIFFAPTTIPITVYQRASIDPLDISVIQV